MCAPFSFIIIATASPAHGLHRLNSLSTQWVFTSQMLWPMEALNGLAIPVRETSVLAEFIRTRNVISDFR
jgi:hypothetical protein